MNSDQESFTESVSKLSHTVSQAITTFTLFSEDLSAEGQTAREVLSHLVFWHREYVNILSDLLESRPLKLRTGKFRELNELAYAEFRDRSMDELADLFSNYQARLDILLNRVLDPSVKMPVKQGSHDWRVIDLVERVEAHIRSHLHRLEVAQRSYVKAP